MSYDDISQQPLTFCKTSEQSMNNRFFIVITVAFATVFLFTVPGHSAVPLPWSTTYNCGEWTTSDGQLQADVNCDNLTAWGGWTCGGGEEEQITAAANYPGGGGGRGQRHWEGDGWNSNSGGTRIEFTSAQPELWVRWYMRYEAGFQWNPLTYDKILYFDTGQSNAIVVEFYGSDKLNIWSLFGDQNLASSSGTGWSTLMGGGASDGQWHYYEFHIKVDTTGNNGVTEMWIDGVRRLNIQNINFGGHNGWHFFVIGSNQRAPSNGRCMYVDFDDIAVSTTGYIGPLSDTIAPGPPTLQ
jgi:hypothetical protein